MAGGRPLLFKDEIKLVERIQEFFDMCRDTEEIPTISGLAVHLDTSRETLCNYEKKETFFDTIKGAKDKVIALQEQLAMKGKINPTVWIFSAKNNLGYTDERKTDITSNGMSISISEAIAGKHNVNDSTQKPE
jgi:hypothetical protein